MLDNFRSKMSTFNNYEKACKDYDNGRLADGAEFMCTMLEVLKKTPLNEMSILEAGCGTDNYGKVMLESGVKYLTMADASTGMLACAREKTKQFAGRVSYKHIVMPQLEFDKHSFDAVIFMQCLHHIDNIDGNSHFPNLTSVLKNTFEILKPGGVCYIDTTFQDNFLWWQDFCPKAITDFRKRFASKEFLIELLDEIGFTNITFTGWKGANVSKPDVINKIEYIEKESWRNQWSDFTLIEQHGELEDLIQIIKHNQSNGTMKEFKQKAFRKFNIFGDHSVLYCRKP